jgi:hypothetical protein
MVNAINQSQREMTMNLDPSGGDNLPGAQPFRDRLGPATSAVV